MDLAVIEKVIRVHRSKRPLTMCIQNFVAMDFSANVLLAAGASPTMMAESPDMCAIASALSVNVGTALSPIWIAAMNQAAAAAREHRKPWCLDPVACGATPHRTAVCVKLMDFRPTVVRGNASEIMALAVACKVRGHDGLSSPGGKGADSIDSSEDALQSALALCRQYAPLVVAVSGATDIITDGKVIVRVENGQEMLTKITAAGCSLSCICASYSSVVDDPIDGVVAAFLHFTVASDEAAAMPEVKGPGTMRVHLLNKLYALTGEEICSKAKVSRMIVAS